MIRAIIFDFFDVIRTDAYKSWLRDNGIGYEGPYREAARQHDMAKLTPDGFAKRLGELRGQQVTRAELDAAATVDQAVVGIIKQLRGHYRLALLSNSSSSLIREILTEHRLEQYFDQIVVSSEVGMVKPSAEIFELTLDRLGVVAGEAVFIDDNPRYTEAAAGSVSRVSSLFRQRGCAQPWISWRGC